MRSGSHEVFPLFLSEFTDPESTLRLLNFCQRNGLELTNNRNDVPSSVHRSGGFQSAQAIQWLFEENLTSELLGR